MHEPALCGELPTSSSEELCDLERGPRSASLVYLAVIGGVPAGLLPEGEDARIDWTPILGRDPGTWDETGIDSHMLQSRAPRMGLPPPSRTMPPIRLTAASRRRAARISSSPAPSPLFDRNDAGEVEAVRRSCDDTQTCDCDGTSDAPLCALDDRRVQIRGKAYPSRRPLLLAKNMGEQGIVASLCPKQLTRPEADDYGYRPAVRAITSRLERSLVGSCLPRAIPRTDGDTGEVACLVLAMLPEDGPDAACERFGLEAPPAALLAQARDRLRESEEEASMRRPICVVPQVTIAKGEVCKDARRDRLLLH